MDVLLIEANGHRRVSIARQLAESGHRVTLSSAVEEAAELLQFVEEGDMPPDVVVIAEDLLDREAEELRRELDHRSLRIAWLPLRREADAAFLEAWLHKAVALR